MKSRETRQPRRAKKDGQRQAAGGEIEPGETRASQVIALAWTVSVTGVTVADLIVIAAHFYLRSQPAADRARALEAMMLIAAAMMGAASLALLAVAWRTRRVKPPKGFAVFAALVAAAPVVTLLVRLLY